MINTENFQKALNTISSLSEGINSVIKGKEQTIRLILTALIADGHVLLEDYPGSGKTTLTKTIGSLIATSPNTTNSLEISSYRRIQFTPDMLPTDVLGVNIFEPTSGKFRFVQGPVFAQIVLADEINRTSPKVQAAFLECMAEKQVTIDGLTHKLDELFFVIGTQNPLDIAGTYPLPIVQLDRFLLKLPMSYVDKETEIGILMAADEISGNLKNLKPVANRDDIIQARSVAHQVYIHPSIVECLVNIAQASRKHPATIYGLSTRAVMMTQIALKALALVNGRNYVSEEDIKELIPFAFLHRVKFQAGSGQASKILAEIYEPELDKLITTRLNQEA